MFNLGGFEGLFIVVVLLALATLAFDIWMLVDAIQRPPERYPAPEQKTWWIVGFVVGLGTGLPAIAVAIAYYLIVRKPGANAPYATPKSPPSPPPSPGREPAPPPPVAPGPPLQNCRNCGAKLAAGARFCHSCGTPTS